MSQRLFRALFVILLHVNWQPSQAQSFDTLFYNNPDFSFKDTAIISTIDLGLDNDLDFLVGNINDVNSNFIRRIKLGSLLNSSDTNFVSSSFDIANPNVFGFSGLVFTWVTHDFWVDYNNDGLLDLVANFDSSSVFELYTAIDSSRFLYTKDILPGLNGHWISAFDADINNDGRIDFVVNGTQKNLPYTDYSLVIYIDSMANITVDTLSPLDGNHIKHGGGGFAHDYNNDGIEDITLFTGKFKHFPNGNWVSDTSQNQVYISDSIVGFTPVKNNLPRLFDCSVFKGFFDTISGEDILVIGKGTPFYSNINNPYFYYYLSIDSVAVYPDSISYNWFGYDTLISGLPSFTFQNAVHRGNQVVDINQDGLSDILFGNQVVLLNSPTGGFDKYVVHVNGGNPAVNLRYGDFNNDGLMDFSALSNDSTFIFIKDTGTINSQPLKVTNIVREHIDEGFKLTWDLANDFETVSVNLTYNIRVGVTPGGSEIVSPKSNPFSGFNRVTEEGMLAKNQFQIKNLPDTTYYYSIQTVDAAYRTSDWTNEKSFILSTMEESQMSSFRVAAYPNPSQEYLNLAFESSENRAVSVFDANGQLISKTYSDSQLIKLNLIGVPTGLYMIVLESEKGAASIKFLKK